VFELPKTNVNFQFGQYNSINQDNSFSGFAKYSIPYLLSAKSGLYKAELQSSELQQQATANEIKAQVQYWFYQLQYLQTTKKQLQDFR
jgi:cobalt-zinc-cadmium resistance protein CzcA